MTDNPQPAWPRRWPICRFAGLGLSLLGGLILVHSWMRHAPALERFYLSDYALLTTLPDIPRLPQRGASSGNRNKFPVVFVGSLAATIEPSVKMSGPVSVRLVRFTPAAFAAWLRVHIYAGQSLVQVLRWPLTGFTLALVVFVGAGFYLDREHDSLARNGRLLQGPP